jgi:uncharacterized RDD family membrane protein YckC
MTGGDEDRFAGQRAGFWRRLGAVLIDGLIVGLVQLLVLRLLGTAGYLVDLVLQAGYFTYFEGSSGQTPGKRVLGIWVLDARTAAPIGARRALGRYLCSLLSALVFYLGYLWMLWDRDRQTWHDKLAGAVVVPAADVAGAGQPELGRDAWSG